ncbi:glycosyltransferase [Pedobacter cryoconitis]|uniref:Glycosyltransferase involved in cell wall biosynthesis n=1 Tax=Pedobacter cryoconitis TaxID=188932 RepID=A0A327SD49_9SPHI|nr:glycosyltransferase [Pedobacter cryoconitis]RAJ25583.1 glycosyltransferase involved in cell wall biosynthesis [Pedobacter cryoconitis]
MRKIRVIEAVNQLGLGGTEYVLQLFSKFLNKEYFEVTAVALKEGGARVKLIEDLGIQVIVLNGDLNQLAELLKETDVFHWHHGGELPHDLFSVINANKPKIVMQTNVFGSFDNSPFYPILDYDLYVSKMILIRRMEKDKNLPDNFSYKRKVLHNPVDVDHITSLLPTAAQIASFKQQNNLKNTFIAGRIGRADDHKFDTITLDAFAEFAAKVPEARFLLVGATPKMRDHAEKLGITDRLIIFENTSDLQQLLIYYKAMDVYMAISAIGESFGMVIAEAMVAGIPVVTVSTKKRDNAQVELVDNHHTGLVVRHDKRKIANALRLLYKNKDFRLKLAASSRQKVQEEYRANDIVRSMELLIFKHLGMNSHEHEKPLFKDFSTDLVNDYIKRCIDLHGSPEFLKKLLYQFKKVR